MPDDAAKRLGEAEGEYTDTVGEYYKPVLGNDKAFSEYTMPSRSLGSGIGEGSTLAANDHHHNVLIPIVELSTGDPVTDATIIAATGYRQEEFLDGCLIYVNFT